MKMLTKYGLMIVILLAVTINLSAQEILDAVRKGDLAKVKELVEKDPQLVKAKKYPTRSSNGAPSTLLHVAGELDNEKIVEYLIEKGADINAQDGAFLTPIMYAGIKVAKLLVERGVDINIRTPNGKVLTWLFFLGRKETAEYLIDKGIILPELGTQEGESLLAQALENGSIKYLDKYLQNGLTPQYESEAKNTLLHLAAAGNSTELINKLITIGVQLNKTNIYSWTPLHTAAYNGNKEIIEVLIKNGADKNLRTVDGSSPCNLALEAKKTDVVNFLISAGADYTPQKFPELTGEYLGESKPGKKAVPFAPGIISSRNAFHGSLTFSPDGTEVYWSVQGYNLLGSKKVNGKWTLPEIVVPDADIPFITPDGKQLFFRNVEEGLLYVKNKTPEGWSEPQSLPKHLSGWWQISTDEKGKLYFGGGQDSNVRIYYSEYENGTYSKPVIMENLKEVEAFSPYIAPDGSYMIISKRSSGLSILFKKRDGSWTKEKDIALFSGGNNTECPMVTHDGKYLFFLKTVDSKVIPYWMDASFIEELRKTELNEN